MGYSTPHHVDILFALVHASEPLTAAEIEGELDGVKRSTVGNHLANLWRDGFVIRRKREEGGRGKNPYEYAVAPDDGDAEPYTGRVECSVCGRASAMFQPGVGCTNGWCEGVYEPA